MNGVPGRAWAIGAAAFILAAACGPPPSAGGRPALSPTAVPATTSTPASPTPRPSPVVSAHGAIVVTEPASGERIASPVALSGEASVFEATVRYRVVTAGGKVLAEGSTTATAGAPQKGTFKAEVPFEAPYSGESGFVEVFELSPKDGTVSEIARVPVAITGSY